MGVRARSVNVAHALGGYYFSLSDFITRYVFHSYVSYILT